MRWVHGTWQCPRCRFKLGCCEGEPQSCGAFGAPFQTSPGSTSNEYVDNVVVATKIHKV
jgi:hypothetical protein